MLGTIVGGFMLWVLTNKFLEQDKERALSANINTDNHAKTTVNNSVNVNNSANKNNKAVQIHALTKSVTPPLASNIKRLNSGISKKQPSTANQSKTKANKPQIKANNHSTIILGSTFGQKGTSQDTTNNKKRNLVLVKRSLDSPHEKIVVKEVAKSEIKKTDTTRPKVIPPFRPKIVPKTKLNKLVISTGRDKPWIHIDSTYKYSDQYRARNLGGVYFWTDCLDCNWRIHVRNHTYNKQGVIVSNKMPNKKWLDSSMYFVFYANTQYALYIEDDNEIEGDGDWSIIVNPGQTKIIYIGKTLPTSK